MAKSTATAGPTLPYMSNQEFEDEAALLLAEFGAKHGQVTAPPVPVDEIVELYLGLRLGFHDLRQLFGVDDVHGALWVNDRRVGIDQRLDPDVNPAMLGRYRFTLAHEAGHWRLHRHLFQRSANQLKLLPDNADRPEYICRSSDKEPIELQADRFAACLLMPRDMVKRTWHEWRGSMEPISLEDLQTNRRRILTAELTRRGGFKSGDRAVDDVLLEHAARPLAQKFEVSPEAMRIRLETLALLVRSKETSLFE
ncbi:MAG: ImmA/IrrE family metallo-endopeptidase [Planctomycetes bacterium]|nr:ImmA/IrrE family metallo-endopeptidase [Planctomycetota bacterium]